MMKGTAMKIDTLMVGPIQTNCYIVYNEGAEEAVVIDPGADAEKIRDYAESMPKSRKIIEILREEVY